MAGESVPGRAVRKELRPGLLGPGDRVPAIVLPSAPDGQPVRLRDGGRDALVVVFLQSAEAEEARAFLRDFAEAYPSLRRWDVRVVAILPAGLEPVARLERELHPPFPLVADERDEAGRRCGVDRGTAALLIADRWGQVYHAVGAPTESGLPLASADGIIMQWLRYMATQCPECGVPDEPGRGEWAQ